MKATHSKLSVKQLTIIALLIALVFVTSSMQIQLPGTARIHFGNIMCLLSGILFGPLVGGLSAGFGSMLFDLSNPKYITEFWITFITKGCMGLFAGLLYRSSFKKLNNNIRILVASLSASVLYVILYLAKTFFQDYFINGVVWDALWVDLLTKAGFSLVNGTIAVVGCYLLAKALQPALIKTGVIPPLKYGKH